MQKLIVDGYNVIHADPKLKKTVRAGMQGAREGLIARVLRYLEHKNVQVTVVFDGRGGITDAEVVLPGRLQVLYSATGQTADDFIVDTLFAHPNPREFIVVTSDMADIGSRVSPVGARVLSSSEFLERIRQGAASPAEEEAADAVEDEPPTPREDVDFWLEQFEKRGDRGGED